MVLLEEKTLTVKEFLELDLFEDGYFYELINGEIVKRSSPDTDHQNASSNLTFLLQSFVREKKLGQIFFAPYDVFLDEENMLQPDIIFVAKESKAIIKKGCIEGAPNLVVEILSRGTFKKDRGDKFNLCRSVGIPEYWIVDPRSETIEIYVLQKGDYEPSSYAMEKGEIESQVLVGLKVEAADVFAQQP